MDRGIDWSENLLIVCVDDGWGLSFHERRQSMDRALRAHLMELCGEHIMYADDYTLEQFEPGEKQPVRLTSKQAEELAQKQVSGPKNSGSPYALWAERDLAAASAANFDRILVCRWNRMYPADVKLELDAQQWDVEVIGELEGSSHPRITLELWKRKGINS